MLIVRKEQVAVFETELQKRFAERMVLEHAALILLMVEFGERFERVPERPWGDDPMDSVEHEAKIDLTDNLPKLYDLPIPKRKSKTTVTAGQINYVVFQLVRRAKLKVEDTSTRPPSGVRAPRRQARSPGQSRRFWDRGGLRVGRHLRSPGHPQGRQCLSRT